MSRLRDIFTMEKKKRNRLSTYPRTCKCGELLKNKNKKSRHTCKIDPEHHHEDIICNRLMNDNYMQDFKKLKCDIQHDKDVNEYIKGYMEDNTVELGEDKKLIAIQSLFTDIPSILADGAYIKFDIFTNTLYYVPCNKRTESVFKAMLKNDELESINVLDLNESTITGVINEK